MKTLLASLCLLVGLNAFGQTAVRSLGGSATNLGVWGAGLGYPIVVNGGNGIRVNNSSGVQTLQIGPTIFSGDGSGLTNLNLNSGPTPAPVVYNGKFTFVSNVFFNVTSYSTNSAASETTIDMSKSYRAFATNNNTAFSALAGLETERTNVQTCNIFITNSSAAAKTITMAAAFQNMNASDGNTLYVTNVGHLLVFFYPGFGTNFYFKSR